MGFSKVNENNWRTRGKQIKAIEGNKKQLDNKQQDKNELLFSKEREILKNIYSWRLWNWNSLLMVLV